MEWLLERFSSDPRRAAFTHEGRQVSYGEVLEKVDAWSTRISATGIRPRETVAVLGTFRRRSCA